MPRNTGKNLLKEEYSLINNLEGSGDKINTVWWFKLKIQTMWV